MAKGRVVPDNDVWPKSCPRCWKKKDKLVWRDSAKSMEKHYRIKHPSTLVPDEFYTGQYGPLKVRLAPYNGPFPVGTRVRLVGLEKRWPEECPLCGALRPTIERMTRHYEKKHKKERLPRQPRFFDSEARQIEGFIEAGGHVIGKKGVVIDVTPAGFGGPRTPAIIHIRLNKPIPLKYWDWWVMSCLEGELEILD